MTLRHPPQSIESEQAVIGGLMLKPQALDRVVDLLTVESFYRRDHQMIFAAMLELAEKKRAIDRPGAAATAGAGGPARSRSGSGCSSGKWCRRRGWW